MKFTSVALAFAAFGAYTSALQGRDLQDRDLRTIQGVLDKVSSGITSLGNAARSFSGNTKPIVDKAKELINTINTGKTTVDGSSRLTLAEAPGLIPTVQALTKKAQALADGFAARRSDVEKANSCSTVRDNLDQISRSSRNLINSIISKVPEIARGAASEFASDLTRVLDQAKNDFSSNKCKNSGSKPRSAAATEISLGGSSSAPPTWTTKASSQDRVPTAAAPTIPGPAVTAGAAVMAPASALAMVIAAALMW